MNLKDVRYVGSLNESATFMMCADMARDLRVLAGANDMGLSALLRILVIRGLAVVLEEGGYPMKSFRGELVEVADESEKNDEPGSEG